MSAVPTKKLAVNGKICYSVWYLVTDTDSCAIIVHPCLEVYSIRFGEKLFNL